MLFTYVTQLSTIDHVKSSKSATFYKSPLQAHKNVGSQNDKKIYARGQALPKGIRSYVSS